MPIKEYKCPHCKYCAVSSEHIERHLSYMGDCPNPTEPTFYTTPQIDGIYGAMIFISPSCSKNTYIVEFLKATSAWHNATKTDDNNWIGFEFPLRTQPDLFNAVTALLRLRFCMRELE